jgi:hypothetical protein
MTVIIEHAPTLDRLSPLPSDHAAQPQLKPPAPSPAPAAGPTVVATASVGLASSPRVRSQAQRLHAVRTAVATALEACRIIVPQMLASLPSRRPFPSTWRHVAIGSGLSLAFVVASMLTLLDYVQDPSRLGGHWWLLLPATLAYWVLLVGLATLVPGVLPARARAYRFVLGPALVVAASICIVAL